MHATRSSALLVSLVVLGAGCAAPIGPDAGTPGSSPAATTAQSEDAQSPRADRAPTTTADGTAGVGTEASPATGSADATPGEGAPPSDIQPPRVNNSLDCTSLRVTVVPEYWDYNLGLVYLDTQTGEEYPIYTSRITGPFEDPFAGTGFVVRRVEVFISGTPAVSERIPDRCVDAGGAAPPPT